MGTRIDLTELPAITEEVPRMATVHPLKGVMGQSATQEQVWPSIEHSASLLKSVRLNATLALGQTFHPNTLEMDLMDSPD